jgi:hypothetical protein
MATAEIWKPVVGYEGLYEVSDLGRVRSLWRSNGCGRVRRSEPFVLREGKSSNGYVAVTLCKDGAERRISIHRLVLTAFVGPCPSGMEAAHSDGVRANCGLTNLSWKSHRDNIADKVAHGTQQVGERNPAALLTRDDVVAIRRDYRRGCRTSGAPALGRRYGVSPSAILAVVHGVNWQPAAMAA